MGYHKTISYTRSWLDCSFSKWYIPVVLQLVSVHTEYVH